MKAIYTGIIARKILLVFLSFTILLSIAAFFVRNNITHKLENISALANQAGEDQSKPGEVLLILRQAEDDFQEALLNNNSSKSSDYKKRLSLAFAKIDSLLKAKDNTTSLTSDQRKKIKVWYNNKLQLSNRLYPLKHNFDSLLNAYADFNEETGRNLPQVNANFHVISKSINSTADTVRKRTTVPKKGFFGRIKDAIANKTSKNTASEIIEIRHNNDARILDSTLRKNAALEKKTYTNRIKQLQNRNLKLLQMQRQLISLNNHINNELELIVNEVKEINYNLANEFKAISFKNYEDTTALLNKLYLTALFLLFIFAVLLIVFILQLNQSELFLRAENDRSVMIAQQKMDLLLHMSHEVRNPLTSINGLLYIFGKSNLSQKQVDMLASIKISSEMLLRTLNDTLDAAKMENSDFKINSEPFNPDVTLKSVMESMEFSAIKKGLTMKYNFKGDNEVVLRGDSFRLEQIMVNLLSNAIKYTDKGEVIVNAELIGDGNKLLIDIIDSGAGITVDQQSRLFSKYYQTNSSKGKVGTGLGLYICKQLIDKQGGSIQVKSNSGQGTTFSFSIPYQPGNHVGSTQQTLNAPQTSLHGISVLAVDDNEVNLMFLRKMTQKWGMIFFQAENGKEAFDIITKNEIRIVLTDIAMPEVDGHELLNLIKKLPVPLNQIPVIMMSGNPDGMNSEKISTNGFAGIIHKPFTELEVINQLNEIFQ
ncbi:hybrid sensor histidine kinase/response regulator [Mucilaginibacter aquaedulcis]|uniref:hybrid sensor histidine kinase/response regulator n=1 Tax=Mucilaginibacter aquaedulcis TaxID=1187081 RepID=UPI0025B4012B|nr:hybrid sensor histidine kinase/response regulator [Mucilaginibacter aquaedulcis]MDN3548103.1 hybrid sensor histidine kinase/response regulator [Mucilaginibacter aquaedulcis]